MTKAEQTRKRIYDFLIAAGEAGCRYHRQQQDSARVSRNSGK